MYNKYSCMLKYKNKISYYNKHSSCLKCKNKAIFITTIAVASSLAKMLNPNQPQCSFKSKNKPYSYHPQVFLQD